MNVQARVATVEDLATLVELYRAYRDDLVGDEAERSIC